MGSIPTPSGQERKMLWLSVSVVVVCLAATCCASSNEIDDTPDDNMAKTFGVLTAEVRDSILYPVLLNPLSINKLTCGSVLTLFDNSDGDITVAADICLITLLLGKLMVLLPIILENLNVDLQNGVFGAIGSFQEGVNKVQSGVDNNLAGLEKPIEALAGFPDKLKSFGQSAAADAAAYAAPQPEYNAPQAGHAAPNPYFSRKKTYADYDYANTNTFESRKDSETDVDYVDLSQLKEEDLAGYYNLPRSFQAANIETDLQNILQELEGAISITRN